MALLLAGNLSYKVKKILLFCTLGSTENPWNLLLATGQFSS